MGIRATDVLRIVAGAACLSAVGVVGSLHLLTYSGVSPLDDLAWVRPLPVSAGGLLAIAVVLLGVGPRTAEGSRWPVAVFVVGLAYFVALVVARNVLTGDYWYNGRTGLPEVLEDGTFALVNFQDGVVTRIEAADYRWLRRLRFLVSSAFCLPIFGAVGLACVLRQRHGEPGAAADPGRL